MKTFTINIHPKLENVTITVKNGRKFTDAVINGTYERFSIQVSEEDLKRIKQFCVKYGNDNKSNKGQWHAHCNGYAMDLTVFYTGHVSINTYRPYGKTSK